MTFVKRNIFLLALSQGLLLTTGISLVAMMGLVGSHLAPSPIWVTFPLTVQVLGSAISTIPLSFLMKRFGRRLGFQIGTLSGILGALIGAVALHTQSFSILCVAAFFSGIYSAAGQYYRFAAADVSPTETRSRAISLVLAGGILGGVLGPEIGRLTRTLMDPMFMGSFLSLAGVGALAFTAVSFLRMPPLSKNEVRGAGRALGQIAKQYLFLTSVAGAAIGYGVMNLLMTATPLAMQGCGHSFNVTAHVLEIHVIAMFAPSFFTGDLIKKFGAPPIMAVGATLYFLTAIIAYTGTSGLHFGVALGFLGLGWNFLFIGGTALLTQTYTNEEKAKVQGVNDFIIALTMGVSSFFSGALVKSSGWQTLALLILAPTAITLGLSIVAWIKSKKEISSTPILSTK